jgi:hypothetical protein
MSHSRRSLCEIGRQSIIVRISRARQSFTVICLRPSLRNGPTITEGRSGLKAFATTGAGLPLGLLGLKPQGPRPCPVLKGAPKGDPTMAEGPPNIFSSTLSPRAPAPMIRHWLHSYLFSEFRLSRSICGIRSQCTLATNDERRKG